VQTQKDLLAKGFSLKKKTKEQKDEEEEEVFDNFFKIVEN
jgi:hypothetical protein